MADWTIYTNAELTTLMRIGETESTEIFSKLGTTQITELQRYFNSEDGRNPE